MHIEEVYTRAEAARILKLSPKTLANHASLGTGPRYVRPGGGRPRYLRADLDAWAKGEDDLTLPRLRAPGRPRKAATGR